MANSVCLTRSWDGQVIGFSDNVRFRHFGQSVRNCVFGFLALIGLQLAAFSFTYSRVQAEQMREWGYTREPVMNNPQFLPDHGRRPELRILGIRSEGSRIIIFASRQNCRLGGASTDYFEWDSQVHTWRTISEDQVLTNVFPAKTLWFSRFTAPSDDEVQYDLATRGKVQVSTDGGTTWRAYRLPKEIAGYPYHYISIDGRHPAKLAVDGKISNDYGRTWRLPREEDGELSLTTRPRVQYATRKIPEGWKLGVTRSEDGGKTWERLPYSRILSDPLVEVNSLAPDEAKRAEYMYSNGLKEIVVSPVDRNTLFVICSRGLARSINGGVSWELSRLTLPVAGDVTSLVFHPSNARTIFLGTETRGLFISKDLGETWEGPFDPCPE